MLSVSVRLMNPLPFLHQLCSHKLRGRGLAVAAERADASLYFLSCYGMIPGETEVVLTPLSCQAIFLDELSKFKHVYSKYKNQIEVSWFTWSTLPSFRDSPRRCISTHSPYFIDVLETFFFFGKYYFCICIHVYVYTCVCRQMCVCAHICVHTEVLENNLRAVALYKLSTGQWLTSSAGCPVNPRVCSSPLPNQH